MSGNVHAEVTPPDASMLLREHIKRLVGNGVHASWKSLPEVKSSGLLETLSERQVALEELKFCLITCEVVYNTELAELVNLSKRSISWADPLPTFNRRTIASTVERVKRCSDGFLNTFEKHWNMKPVVNLAILSNMLVDMALQFQNYVTYCAHQEDFRAVLRNAMRSKCEVIAVSFSNRLNVERVMLPLQHLKLYRSLLQDIRSMLMSTTNRLEHFHCKRILTDITKLLEECYKILATLHGSLYVNRLDSLLDECVHAFEPEPAENNNSKHQENNFTDSHTICCKQSTDSVDNTDSKSDCNKSSEVCRWQDVNKNRFLSVRERCKFFSFQTVEKNCRDMVKYSDNRNSTCKRQRNSDVTLKRRSSPIVSERCAVFEVGEPNNNFYKASKYPPKSRSLSMYETVYMPLENEGSNKHTAWLKTKLKISTNDVSKPPHVTSLNSTNSLPSCIPNLTKSRTESSCDVITENSIRNKCEVENYDHHRLSTVEEDSVPSHNNGCQKLSIFAEQFDADDVHSSPTSPLPPPLKVLCTTVKTHTLENGLYTNGFQTGSEYCANEEKREVQNEPPNEKKEFSDHFSSLSDPHFKPGSSLDGMPSSMASDITDIKGEFAVHKLCNKEQSPEPQKKMFISSYNLGCLSTPLGPELPLQKEIEMDEIYNDYEPMNESFGRNCYQFKPISPSKLLDRKVRSGSETDYDKGQKTHTMCNIRIEDNLCDTSNHLGKLDMDSNISNGSLFSTFEDAPLYQVYNFESVKNCSTKREEHIYIEPDEHVYEEINFHVEPIPQSNEKEDSVPSMEISKPSGTSQRVRWIDIPEVINSGLLNKLDSSEIALQEAKYEIITSEASYYKSLVILETVFIRSPELTNRAILSEEAHNTLFSSVKEVKRCSEKFLGMLVDGWQEDLILGYLCHAISKFISSGDFQVYVDCCASQINIDKILQYLRLTDPEFTSILSTLEADPVCQAFSLQTFLTLPMQRVTRLPLLVQAILRRLPSDHTEHGTWTEALIQLQEIVNECNEATGRAETLAEQYYNHPVQPNNKALTLNMRDIQQEKKKQTTIWNIFRKGNKK